MTPRPSTLARASGLRRHRHLAVRGPILALGVLTIAAMAGLGATPASATPAAGAQPSQDSFSQTWIRTFSGVVALSSPAAVHLAGNTPSMVVGTRGGQVQAFELGNGSSDPGWPVTVSGSKPVDSPPSIGPDNTVYVGVGNAASPTGGGYEAISPNGKVKWFKQVDRTPGSATKSGVQAGLSYGALAGTLGVVAGSLGQYEDALNTADGAALKGFPWFSSDSEFSTPAVTNLYGTGKNYIIGGAEQTAGSAYGVKYKQGGHLRVLRPTGNAGTGAPGGGVGCSFTPNQGVYSSPAVGKFFAGNVIGITFGTSTDFANAPDTDKLFALNKNCAMQWKASLNGSTSDSPALVDALGNGGLQIAEGTITGSTGWAYLLNGANGKTLWSTHLAGEVIGSITSANFGEGYQDLLVPTTAGLYVLDGLNGNLVAHLGQGQIGLQSSALVTADPDGMVGITIAGYNAKGGIVIHYDVKGSSSAAVGEAGSWSEFHHDPQLTGSTLPPLA